MKTKIYTLLFILISIPTVAFAYNGFKGRYTKEKKVKKEFTVNPDARLKIDNSYGNVNIISWDENRTVIEVFIKTNGNNEERVQEKLDEIDVEFDGSDGLVSAVTKFNKEGGRSWWKSWKSSNVNMEIRYEVKVPVTNDLDIDNEFGNIYINKTNGVTKINCKHGNLSLGELLADNNSLALDYVGNSTIEYIKSGRIKTKHSSFNIEKSGTIELNAEHTTSVFGVIENLNYACEFGKLQIDTIGNLMGRGDHLTTTFETVQGDVNLNTNYGSVRINELSASAGDVIIQSDYTGIKLGYNSQYNFTFNISLEYAGLGGKDDLEFTKKRIESSDKYYEGYHGNANSQNNININSEYGGVTFTKI
ncbi:hypothetical protein [uncultured Dokdonia sp.]|uniref:hypothetical protein n=1 Tax=uncultured Dokdonia sp. TaxID=575653 RepID=UPI00261DE0FD|nr:hypothetical protein [uncultured Dokdonia sp.]